MLDLSHLVIEKHPNGRVHKVRGDMPLPQAASDEAAITAFLSTHAQALKLEFDTRDLRLVHKVQTPTRTVYRYQHMIGGVPVRHSEVIVHSDSAGSVKQIESPHLGHLKSSDVAALAPAQDMGADAALQLVMKKLGKSTLRGPAPTSVKVYAESDGGLVLAYEVTVATGVPMHDWQYVIDAATGAVLDKRDLLMHLPDGSGMVFEPNPVVTANNNTFRQPGATVATCGYAGTALATIDAQRVSRTLKDLTLSGGVHSLDGPFARIVNLNAPASTIPTEAVATNFNYSSSDERFGAVNLYYHVDTIQRYVQSLGITTANNRRTDADPSNSSTYSAFYSPVDKSLHMGQSHPCHPDKAHEGDAIVHEYGHAIQDNQVPGWGVTNPATHRDETRAMGEGFGDILACVFFANAGNQFQRETFEDWAFVENGAAGLRRVDGTKVYPTDWTADEHDNGEIWSAALWNIYRAIGGDSLVLAERQAARDALLKTVILSHHHLATSASMPDGAEAVMTTHAELDDYRGRYLMQMLNSFHDRGLLRCDAHADLWLHDDLSDVGTEPFAGSVFWESPDLWVRQANDNGTTHQEPEFGQDNWFYARVTNRGTTTARAFVVTFNVKPWAGVQFAYPADFVPYISAAVGFNLAPGASTIVKAKWPKGLIPPAGTHACLLGQVYTPVDKATAGQHVWDKNNLAQKNMTVVDLAPNDSYLARFQLGTLHERLTALYRVELFRPPQSLGLPVSLVAGSAADTVRLFRSADKGVPTTPGDQAPPSRVKGKLRLLDPARAEFMAAGEEAVVTLELAPQSAIHFSDGPVTPGTAVVQPGNPFLVRTARLVQNAQAAEIVFNEGKVAGFPVIFQPASQLKCVLKVTMPKDAKPGQSFKLQLALRGANGRVVGGISLVLNAK